MSDQPADGISVADSPVEIEFVARAGSYYRMTRYAMFLLFLLMGAWFCYDGFINWPHQARENADADAHNLPRPYETRGHWDIPLNQLLGVVLPPLGVVLLIWTFYNSRGAYRLSGTTLSIPGHPMMQLSDLRSVDKAKWDKKGIAFCTYRMASGKSGNFKLDDFVYERIATDEIFKRIDQQLAPPKVEQPKPKVIPLPPRIRT